MTTDELMNEILYKRFMYTHAFALTSNAIVAVQDCEASLVVGPKTKGN